MTRANRSSEMESVADTKLNPEASGIESDSPGVPGFRTWRGIYLFVFAFFVVVVVLLTIFSRHFE